MYLRNVFCLVAGLAGSGLVSAAEAVVDPQAPEDPLIVAVAQSSNRFAAELFAQLRGQPGNLAIAPLGLAQALLPIAAGTRGETGEEVVRVLHLTTPLPEAADGFAALTRRLRRSAGGPERLGFARALWVQQGNTIDSAFVELLRQHCRCELRVIDFGRGDYAAHWINRWVSDTTEDRIRAIADTQTFSADTELLVGSGVYFKADWQDDFDPALTEARPFSVPPVVPVVKAAATVAETAKPEGVAEGTVPAAATAAADEVDSEETVAAAPATSTPSETATASLEPPPATADAPVDAGPVAPTAVSPAPASEEAIASATETIEVPTMRRVAPLRVAVEPGFRLLQLPYRGDQLAMVVLLPDADASLAKIEAEMDAARIAECLARVRQGAQTRVELYLPRFKAERVVPQLTTALRSMGAVKVFDQTGAADFSGLGTNADGESVSLGVVRQLVQFSIDERGVESAALSLPSTDIPYDAPVEAPQAFHVDRPFLYFICDRQTGTILFMGRVVDPRVG